MGSLVMRGIVKVVIGGLIVLAIVIAVAVVLNTALNHSGVKPGRALGSRTKSDTDATYSIGKTGFAFTYDSKLLGLENDVTEFNKRYDRVDVVSRRDPRHPDRLQSSWLSIVIIRVGAYGTRRRPLSILLKAWLATPPPDLSHVARYYRTTLNDYRTTLNGMSGVVYQENLRGQTSMSWMLYSHGYVVEMHAGSLNAPPLIWAAAKSAAESFRATLKP
jgi:hypothetical protein